MVYAERESVDEPFTTVNPVSAEGVGQLTGTNPSLTADELVLVFASDLPGGKGDSDIWYATRPDRTRPFSKPRNVPGVNTVDKEREAFIAPDGCTLIFARTPTGLGTKNFFDLFAASYRAP